MIATAAEANPTCFSSSPLVDLEETFVPSYLRLVRVLTRSILKHWLNSMQARYLDNHWSLTKFCAQQFKAQHVNFKKPRQQQYREVLSKARGYDDVTELVGNWTGEEEFRQVVEAIKSRTSPPSLEPSETAAEAVTLAVELPSSAKSLEAALSIDSMKGSDGSSVATPTGRENPEPPSLNAPKLASNGLLELPALVSGRDAMTPSPNEVEVA